MTSRTLRVCACLLAATVLIPVLARAHAIAGDRIFPATLAIDDPGVSDELTLPQVQLFKATDDDGDKHWTTTTSAEWDKLITPAFALSVSGDYVNSAGGSDGFDNAGLGAKYEAFENDAHEFMMSVGLDVDLAHTGAKRIGEPNDNFTPGLFIGKGFGDLPDSMDWVKPFAVTGQFGYELEAGGDNDKSVDYGATLQYSLPYLQQHVKDIGLPAPWNTMIPIVEFAFTTPVNNGEHQTTGTINPGVVFMGGKMQFAVEAVVPINNATGTGIGAQAQLHFYLDDIFPNSWIGRPIFGATQ